MEITFDDFVKVCPAAMAPDTAVFELVSPSINERLDMMRALLTDDVFDRIEAATVEDPKLAMLRQAVTGYACAAAFHDCIPQLDLVLTPTGFGVVSNQNVAPASADRVVALRRQLDLSQSRYFDRMLDLARPIVDWEVSIPGMRLFPSLYWRADHVRLLGIASPTREDLSRNHDKIIKGSVVIEKLISPELYERLILAEATDSATAVEKSLIAMCRNAVAAIALSDDSWGRHRENILRYLDEHAVALPAYLNSVTFQAHHFKPYENQRNDSCFFFG